jgi:hypothetical protein
MTVLTQGLMCVLGIVFMLISFFGTGMGGAFSRTGPLRPISRAGRLLLFVTGTVVFVDGGEQLLASSRWPHSGWRLVAPFAAVITIASLLNSKRVRSYMGRISPSDRPIIAIDFGSHLPSPLVTARIAFFVIVALTAVFGFAPIADSTARIGIVACALALFALAILYAVLEAHYINSSRATEVRLPD